jgi:hypothetical protein
MNAAKKATGIKERDFCRSVSFKFLYSFIKPKTEISEKAQKRVL